MRMRADCRWVVVVVALAAISGGAGVASAQSFRKLADLGGTDGANPGGSLLQGLDGRLYGTTAYGGANAAGTVFKVTTTGTVTTLYSFCTQTGCTDGSSPNAAVLPGTDGNLFGTTFYGGSTSDGVVFEMSPTGTLTTLYAFCQKSNCADGEFPRSTLIRATDGDFYGTTVQGGGDSGNGTIFKITSAGVFTTIYDFCEAGCADGANPESGLVQGNDGNFYGTTFFGGAHGGGTVFRITPTGILTTLYSFCSQANCTDGDEPFAGLIQATDGNFYGTTFAGGQGYCSATFAGCGTVFQITQTGKLTTLHRFCAKGDCVDGALLRAGLIQGTDGNFYGTTELGGVANRGTVFSITRDGALTTLHGFQGGDGAYPYATLVQATNGVFYGTTLGGGSNDNCIPEVGCGTVFTLSTGLGPFVETLPTSGAAGLGVKILGTDLTGATGVTFNGTAANFTVASPSLITTTVPMGATTGTVQVVTPGGTLSSNVPFRVIQ